MKLTARQKQILDFIREQVRKGIVPTIREIGAHFHFSSTGTVRDHVRALIKKGYLKKMSHKARGVMPVMNRLKNIPILGRIPAGPLDLAVEDLEGFLDLEDISQMGEDIFALRVKGESMTGAGIMPGDLALIRRQATAENGDIVVALIGDEATLKRLKKEEGRIRLEAANPLYNPIPTGKDLVILGKVIGVVRRYA